MKISALSVVGAACALTLASLASASPREGATFTAVDSNGSNLATTNSFVATGTYAVKYLHVSATINRVAGGSYPQEANIHVYPPDAFTNNTAFTMQPFQQGTYGAGTSVSTTTFTYKLPTAVASAAGTGTFRYYEAYDDAGAGVDSTWSSITYTLDDGPPANINLGPINNDTRFTFGEGAGEVHWYKFELLQNVTGANGQSLRIGTAGS